MRIYLDFAATSAVRPSRVVDAVAEYLRDCGATPGRGGHSLAVEASRVAHRCRRALGDLLGFTGEPGRVAFGMNATHALNTALWGILEPGDAVVVSELDHNAVLRPAHALARERGIEVRTIPAGSDGSLDLEAARELLEGAKLLVANAVSNVLGSRLPVAELARSARERDVLVLVDAAQSCGHLPVRHPEEGADLVAFTGHKGLLGPQGIGGLWVRPGVDVNPLLTGGTGGDSNLAGMPPSMPDRLEAGTLNAPGIAGLLAGVGYLEETGIEVLHRRMSALKARLREGLAGVPSLTLLSPPAPDGAAIVTVASSRMDPATLADRLDREYGICARPGLHCAPGAHRLLGTSGTGALRFSLGWSSVGEDVDRTVRALDALLGTVTVPVG